MKQKNQDNVGDKCVKNDEGCLAYDDSAKLKAWKGNYERLLNVEFEWDSDSLPDLKPKIVHLYVTASLSLYKMISKAIAKMKTGKAPGPSRIVIKMIKSAGKEIVKSIANLANRIIKEGHIPSDWNLLYSVSLYKGKGDSISRDNYWVNQVMKIIERALHSVIRYQVDIDSMQFGFMSGWGTTDIIFVLC